MCERKPSQDSARDEKFSSIMTKCTGLK